jgi:hypothetical protein
LLAATEPGARANGGLRPDSHAATIPACSPSPSTCQILITLPNEKVGPVIAAVQFHQIFILFVDSVIYGPLCAGFAQQPELQFRLRDRFQVALVPLNPAGKPIVPTPE